MNSSPSNHPQGMTRRDLIGAGLSLGAAGAAAALWSAAPPSRQARAAPPGEIWQEASISELQDFMAVGALTSRELTVAYLQRIEDLNPLLHAVIETNPDAVWIAARLDQERRHGRLRGPLHGIPILLKDNIATLDKLQTTAGSLALVDSRVPADATIVANLRNAGAVILGKANLSEWANFRGFAPFNGWSARGGFTRDPYVLDYDPCGSSSGSAVAVAANFCAAAIGTETDGSIVCPSGNNLVVGLKPTQGLLSQAGIIPIAHSQDTAGPIARNVADVATLMSVLQGRPDSYSRHLRRGALKGARIGRDKRYFTADYGGEDEIIAVVDDALEVMQDLGATIIEVDTGDAYEYGDAEFTVLLCEFKTQIAEYLGGLSGTNIRSLADLIAFNNANCAAEMTYYGQELWEISEVTLGSIRNPEHQQARRLCLRLSRGGIDRALRHNRLDAIVAPSYSFASSPAAVAGYPDLAFPVGLRPDGKPAGIWMYGPPLSEGKLLGLAYDYEQEVHPRTPPQFLGAVPPEPPNAGICDGTAAAQRVSPLASGIPWRHLGTGKLLGRGF